MYFILAQRQKLVQSESEWWDLTKRAWKLTGCRGSLVVLIHLHLNQPIMMSRRKTHDIQFYTEVRAQTEDWLLFGDSVWALDFREI